ncbi:mechanosensitive ion channel family protein [Clostridium estertheticum]|uniref:mechanosensitive ion channel family protein n=1 Tax=Clostridium estertheticum TaxID=238834 RepID=UPI001C0E3464|nr:mechanosensitive ion channel family protein [Clostridium estertheticum]MBU3179403.1 mechanosensitive ion channel family protein [Clostridium estertheticum]
MFKSIVDFFAEDGIQVFFSGFTYVKLRYVGFAIGVFVLFLLLKKIFAKYVFKIILKLVNKTKFNADTKIAAAFERPLINFFEVLGLYFAFKILTHAFFIKIVDIDNVFSSAIVILISWGLYNLTGESSLLFERMHKAYDVKVDKILFPFISKTLRLILIALAITIIAEKWGYNLQGFIAGLGLGGLAFALAAKDAAANIIAGMSIILDKPFTIGDWVKSDVLEGSIENISFRTTKIRTIDEALIIVPNSKLTNEAVINFSRRGKRRVSFSLELNYITSRQKLETCVSRVRSMLENHPQVNKEGILVRFDKLSAASLDILICYFADTPDFDECFRVKEDINFEIADILKQEGILMSFPRNGIYMDGFPDEGKKDYMKSLDMIQNKDISTENNNESNDK